tara:strand:- start:358 stop:768 length:411 start_codon:yes stop_codon:yes gene_type:complete
MYHKGTFSTLMNQLVNADPSRIKSKIFGKGLNGDDPELGQQHYQYIAYKNKGTYDVFMVSYASPIGFPETVETKSEQPIASGLSRKEAKEKLQSLENQDLENFFKTNPDKQKDMAEITANFRTKRVPFSHHSRIKI